MVLRSAIVLLVLLVFVGACASEQIAQEGTEGREQGREVERPQPTAEPTPTPTPTSTPTPTIGPTPITTPAPPCVVNEESDKPCESRDVSEFGLFSDSLGHPSVHPALRMCWSKGSYCLGLHLFTWRSGEQRSLTRSDVCGAEWPEPLNGDEDSIATGLALARTKHCH